MNKGFGHLEGYSPCIMTMKYLPDIERVVYNKKKLLTIVNWVDGTKTIVRCKEDEKFDEYLGFLACVAKKAFGYHGYYKKHIKSAHRFTDKKKKDKK